ncbi:MAG: ATP-binding protein [Pseudomonadota bacterium]
MNYPQKSSSFSLPSKHLNSYKPQKHRIVLIAVGFAVLFWVAESIIHVVIFGQTSWYRQFCGNGLHEIWMRMVVVGLFFGFGLYAQRIINLRRGAEEKLQQAHDELEQRVKERTQEYMKAAESLMHTTEQLSVLLESLPIVPYTCMADKNFGITYVGSSIKEITGYTPSQFMESETFWIDHIHADDRNRIMAKLLLLFEYGKQRNEYRWEVSDGSFKWFSDTRRLVLLADGQPSHVVGTWQDITEEKKIRQESEYRLQQMIKADKLASLGQVVAGVAHEINNPNSFITYNVPLLEDTWGMLCEIVDEYSATHPEWRRKGISLDEMRNDMKEIIEAIKIGSARITKVVGNLKDFARLDESSQAGPVQVNDVIDRALIIVGTQARRFSVRIDTALADNLPEIQGHFQKLEQVIANLVVNAIQSFPNKTGGRLSIATRYIGRLQSILIEMEDNGIGMESAILDRIFDPLFIARRESGSASLGLSVSYGLIREHGGIIGALSRPGIGNRFIALLPVEKDIELNLQPSILCVDDNEEFVHKLKGCFDVEGLAMLSVDEPVYAVERLAEIPEADIVLVNTMMSGFDGWEIRRRIRERFPLLTIILYNSGEQGELKGKSELDIRPDYILKKPVKMEDIMRLIKSITRQKL